MVKSQNPGPLRQDRGRRHASASSRTLHTAQLGIGLSGSYGVAVSFERGSPVTERGSPVNERGSPVKPHTPTGSWTRTRAPPRGASSKTLHGARLLLLVQILCIIEMIWWTGLASWEFEFPFPGSLISSFLIPGPQTRIVDEETRASARRMLEDIAKGAAAAAQDARNALRAA